MIQSAIHTLPVEWQAWIQENLARGCTPDSMAMVMVRDGKFDPALAEAAIREAGGVQRVTKPRPDIDTSSNTIQTPDRMVHVLLSLAAPRIVLLGNVLSDEECDQLCDYVSGKLSRSTVVTDDGAQVQAHAGRTSRGAMLMRGETDLIARVDARLAALAKWPVENGEGLQVQWYDIGNEYRAHFDWFDPTQAGPRKHMEHGGQRVGTFVLYLNDVPQGGGTGFPGLGLEVQPRKGNAVFFANTDMFGTPDRNTLHSGMPVVSGVKVIANKWLRERPY
ncbi:prolyl 4-hydroxylase [Noviherbaspirillum humi]|uniref:Prolyl 4-hydroxylase n=1 Tax=Noviherbaspirillum humi TaxID=1688639 RepID=A0A239HCT6_9BURK|nr:2OG-Fe(II) oxygenase [Noviherbaspirillum humi]SNS78975.1 prolyl 4-hydroxylase [Noviherbaspirillum humi]